MDPLAWIAVMAAMVIFGIGTTVVLASSELFMNAIWSVDIMYFY